MRARARHQPGRAGPRVPGRGISRGRRARPVAGALIADPGVTGGGGRSRRAGSTSTSPKRPPPAPPPRGASRAVGRGTGPRCGRPSRGHPPAVGAGRRPPGPGACTPTSGGLPRGVRRPPSGRRTRPSWSTRDDLSLGSSSSRSPTSFYALPLEGLHAGARRQGQGAEGRQGSSAAAGQEAQEAVGGGLGGRPVRTPRVGAGRPGHRRRRRAARGAAGHGRRRAARAHQAAPPAHLGGDPAGAHHRPRRGAQGHPGRRRPGRGHPDRRRCSTRAVPRRSAAGC